MGKKIGFIGQGWIGKNYADNFEQRGFDVVRYALEEPYRQNKGLIKDCDIVFIAVPTPTTPSGFDDSIVRASVRLVGNGRVAVIKSTLLPGVTESIAEEHPDVFVFHSPEFLTRHTAAYDAANPNRNIVGWPKETEEYKQRAQEVLDVLPRAPFELVCHVRDAELIKYGGNCFFYFKNIFMNMLYDLSQSLNCDWETLRGAIAADHRIGGEHTHPINKGGRGAGGDCLIKDFSAFTALYENRIQDEVGMAILRNLEKKNIRFLIDSKKDLHLLVHVYGNNVIADIKNTHGENLLKELGLLKQ